MKSITPAYWIFGTAAAVLAVPFVAMQFTDEVQWTGVDFLVMGTLLFITALTITGVWKQVQVPGKRFFFIALVLMVFLLIWAELAVGIFGTPFAGN
ncbi:hypothetical protein [Chryseobacterium sp. MFBS3-17]|uniref:hypothetical protein n=1 Tax=Chryseobacterium sp. MFBS3-17 TaxID=2886689 RepID=UPI001D0E9D9D|nr:hypothetical protein [Chryseobacterium sp. MFBS3-17]MCC2589607.1 hypothetical protein [Chryseobacterium sp. MFBS3-17]